MKDNRPTWIQQRRFVVPSSLKSKIFKFDEQSQLHHCYIVNKVVVETKERPKHFASISSKYFKNKIGSGYRDYINQLVTWRVIEVNDSYLADGGKGFSKSYRLHPDVQRDPIVTMNFQKKVVQPLKDNSDLSTNLLRFVHDNLRRVSIKAQLKVEGDLIDEVDAEQSAELVYFKKFDLHYSKVARRLYHTIVLMPKVARNNLVFNENPAEPLYEYDVKSCHPVLLLTLMKDASERAEYFKLLDGDIFTTVAEASGVVADREDIKLELNRFVNGKVENYVHDYFKTHFPILTATVMRQPKKEMARFGQKVESEIMTKVVPRGLLAQCTSSPSGVLTCGGNSKPFYIPMHDGWLGIEDDENVIAGLVRKEFARVTGGYQITITKTSLTNGVKKIRLP